MPRVLFFNSIEVWQNKDGPICIVLKFDGGEGETIEATYANTTIEGAKTLAFALQKHIQEYESLHGQIPTWLPPESDNINNNTQRKPFYG